MRIIRTSSTKYKNPVIIIGAFDGIHIAHKKIILNAKKEAEKVKGITVVLTFDPHPLKVLKRDTSLKLLTTVSEKIEILKKLNVERVVIINFDRNFSKISAEEFIRKILVEKLKVAKVVVGRDFRFGKNRAGDVKFLEEKGKEYNFEVKKIEKISLKDKRVSSSLIRSLLKKGKIEEANEFLGYNYFISGKVVKGDRIGRILSFPTANILTSADKLLPKDGVYAGYVYIKDSKYKAAINIGFSPTFSKKERKVEVYIIGFKGNLYFKNLRVEFLKRIRGERKFKSEKQLIQQIKKDVEKIKSL